MTTRSQKLALLAHITFSVGWLGSVIPYLALAIAALTSRDDQMVRAACVSMQFIGWFVIVPLSLAALISGLVQSLGSRWGLIRYWWIVAKLVLTLIAVAILLQHMSDVSRAATIARQSTQSVANLRPELIHSAGGLLVLLVITTISVFKPWGPTPYGRRQASQAGSTAPAVPSEPRYVATGVCLHGRRVSWLRIIAYHAAALAVAFVVLMHLSGGGFHLH